MNRILSAKATAPRRRGVLLLVVLSLLVLMTGLSATYILFSGQFRRVARIEARLDQRTGTNPGPQLDSVVAQLLRGTPTSSHSVIQTHSLLEDLYGNDGIGPLKLPNDALTVGYDSSGTILQLPMGSATPQPVDANGVTYSMSPLTAQGYYDGLLLTMISGKCNGESTRIIGFDTTLNAFLIGAFASGKKPVQGDLFVINGRPFNGSGAGYGMFTYNGVTAAGSLGTKTLTQSRNELSDSRSSSAAATALASAVPTLNAANHTLLQGVLRFPASSTFNVPLPFVPNYRDAFPGDTRYVNGGRDLGGEDEGYDAADLQNLFLASIVPSGTSTAVVPSFHRPDLINYLGSTNPTQTVWNDTANAEPAAQAKLRRSAVLRPLPTDHPEFTGSNSKFNLAFTGDYGTNPNGYQWDVDNDGDGIPDSVWVDVGLPLQMDADGHKVKPLAAILIVDLDGRLNVNAHGSYADVVQLYQQSSRAAATYIPMSGAAVDYTKPGTGLLVNTPNDANALATAYGSLILGTGLGPAEVSLAPLFNNNTSDYLTFLKGKSVPNTDPALDGRYGEMKNFAAMSSVNTPWDPFTGDLLPGKTRWARSGGTNAGASDKLARMNQYQAWSAQQPMDYWGRGCLGVDYLGHPLAVQMGKDASGNVQWESQWFPGGMGGPANGVDPTYNFDNNPYALNLGRHQMRSGGDMMQTDDNPFAVTELEQLLRPFDVDASQLPSRLRLLLGSNWNSNATSISRSVTTESVDLPCPAVRPTNAMIQWATTHTSATSPIDATAKNILAGHCTIVDLLVVRMELAGASPATIQTAIYDPSPAERDPENPVSPGNPQINKTLLPHDLVAGLRFDLNSPLGNAQDENSNGVIDDPSEDERNDVWTLSMPSGTKFQLDGRTANLTTLAARQRYARFLYVLAMLLGDDQHLNLVPGDYGNQTPADVNNNNLVARRLAQWAVNVVDYRDPDSIMTPFEYTQNVFNTGWTADGDLTTTSETGRNLVWGCEAPDLLITKTLAMHDLRIADTSMDTGSSKPLGPTPSDDEDADQVRVPQGSLFVELYCPRNANGTEKLPSELYNAGQLKLGANDAQSNTMPVWRIVVGKSTGGPDPITLLQSNPWMTEFNSNAGDTQIDAQTPTASNAAHYTIERIIWMTNLDPASSADTGKADVVYYSRSAANNLSPGQYAVIGPRPITHFGRQTGANTPDSDQRIELDLASGDANYFRSGTTSFRSSVSPNLPKALPIICTTNPISNAWASTPQGTDGLGISLSEPLKTNYEAVYNTPPNKKGTNFDVMDVYDPKAINHPFDWGNLLLDTPLAIPFKPNFRALFVQRLANPLKRWNPTTNPYITVDMQTVDLIVFNGEATSLQAGQGVQNPPYASQSPKLACRQRGQTSAAGAIDPNLWSIGENVVPPSAPANGGTSNYDYQLQHSSLGFLNDNYGSPITSNVTSFYGAPDPSTTNNKTFPWLPWANRPLTSAAELMLVPASAPSRLCYEFGNTIKSGPPANYYDRKPSAATNPPGAPGAYLNFFWSYDGVSPPSANAGEVTSNLLPLLDYVHVPTKFVGFDDWIDPSVATALNNTNNNLALAPPFNRFSTYREPGRINLNTISDQKVWDGLARKANGYNPNPATSWNLTSMLTLMKGTKIPSFAHPFQSAAGTDYGLPVETTAGQTAVQGSILRPDSTNNAPLYKFTATGTADDPARNPYFADQHFQRLSNVATTRSNVFAVWVTIGFFETEEIPDTVLTRLQTYSNDSVEAIYPDGVAFGEEAGFDSGQIVRHKGFYIIDRSLPVGFSRGLDLNTKETILLRRVLQ